MVTVHHYFRTAVLFLLAFLAIFYVLALIVSLRNTNFREKYTPAQLATDAGKFAQIDGASVYYEYSRSRSTPSRGVIMLLHGFGANLHTWDQQIPYLQASYDVLAVDMLGFGLSQEIGGSVLGEDAQVVMLQKLIGYLGISKLVVAGNSMGGGIAQRLALTLPHKVTGLILIDSTDMAGRTTYTSLSWLNSPLLAQVPMGLVLTEDSPDTILISTYGNPDSYTTDVGIKYARPYTIKGSLRNLLAHVFAPSSDRLIETGLITQPVLLMWGTKDTWLPIEKFHKLKAGLPNEEVALIEGAGHMPHEEAPAIVNQVLGSWLATYLK